MSHGSPRQVAARAVIDALGARLPGWVVQYDGPRVGTDVRNVTGQYKAVWVQEDGSFSYEPFSLGMSTGYRAEGTVTLLFQRLVEESGAAQSDIDSEVEAAVGELVDLLAGDAKLGGDVVADGWAVGWVAVGSVSFDGGVLPAGNGRGQRASVELVVNAMRCS